MAARLQVGDPAFDDARVSLAKRIVVVDGAPGKPAVRG
jgi:hypothetical protein